MSKPRALSLKLFATLLVGIVLGSLLGPKLFGHLMHQMHQMHEMPNVEIRADEDPLYWVAPMDANYRRDQPGKSPMGMDLVPVYGEEKKKNDAGPGTISISPDVVNNLGVRTTTVQRRALHNEILTVGYVKYDEDQLVHIHPRVSGWVEALHVKASGDPIQKGAPLYALYSPELVSAQEELLLALNRKNTRLIQAVEDRLKSLQIPSAFIEKLKRTKTVEQTITFYSPQTGVVDNLNIREGFFVKPGTTMLSIGALDQVWVEAEIFERQALQVKAGEKVTMTLDYLPGKTWTGSVDYIYPTLDKKTRTVRIRLRFDNLQHLLKPNMFAQVIVYSDSDDQTLVIPQEALIRTGSQNRVVLALGEGSFKSIAVIVGREDKDSIEVLEGLSEGEEIVSSAQFLLDSESSKNSDFKRLHHETEPLTPVWVAGEIKATMPDKISVSARHDPIAEWDWPEMTMDFLVHETVDFSALRPGTQLHMEITPNAQGQYEITDTHIMSKDQDSNILLGSESGKTSDVKPLHHQADQPASVWVGGEIKATMPDKSRVSARHDPIAEWDWPEMTMDFLVHEAVDFAALRPGTQLHMEITRNAQGQYEITNTHIMSHGEGSNMSLSPTMLDH